VLLSGGSTLDHKRLRSLTWEKGETGANGDKPVILNLLRAILLTIAVPVYAALRGRPLQK
jgi:hypothetical protein